MASKHTGKAENMKPGGADESSVSRQNAPLRDLHLNGHDLNHSYKNPVASINGGGVNHSYAHPHMGNPGPVKGFEKANIIKPMRQMGTGRT